MRSDAHLGLIWAQTTAGVIGRAGGIPWHIPEDMAHFRRVTTAQPVIMGRKTWDSLPDRFRPLPDRRNIVVTRQPDLTAPGAEFVGSLDAALQRAGDGPKWVIGGGELYSAAMPLAARIIVTEVDADLTGDAHAPAIGTDWIARDTGQWQESTGGIRFRWIDYIHSNYR